MQITNLISYQALYLVISNCRPSQLFGPAFSDPHQDSNFCVICQFQEKDKKKRMNWPPADVSGLYEKRRPDFSASLPPHLLSFPQKIELDKFGDSFSFSLHTSLDTQTYTYTHIQHGGTHGATIRREPRECRSRLARLR